ncbi:ferric iron ABC transporter, permease protein [Paenibacillus sp. JCM 10914]|nr:ferric iron ABC transporter, permease protein [Paenibacillus sp. JCM 10914]
MFSIISLAVPGVVLGIGYIFIWNQKWLEPLGLHLYGTPSLLVIAGIAGAIPYAVRVQLGAFGNLSGTMLKAAAIQGATIFERMRDIVLPLVRQSLLIAILASFGTSVFDLALASMLRPANYSLMPLVIDRAFEFSRYGYATAATVVSCGIVVVIIIVMQASGRLWFRWLDRNRSR